MSTTNTATETDNMNDFMGQDELYRVYLQSEDNSRYSLIREGWELAQQSAEFAAECGHTRVEMRWVGFPKPVWCH